MEIYSKDSPYWPNDTGTPYSYDTLIAQESGAPMMGAYHIPEHFGTHLDAPIHGGDNLPSVDQLSAQELFGPVAKIDISSQSEANADYQLSKGDLLKWENDHGRLKEGVIVLLYTGWCKKWDDYEAYKNEDAEGQMHFPGFSEEAAHFLIKERNIRGIGIDNLSIDPANAEGFPVHRIVNGSGKFHLENVANLDQVPAAGS